MSTFPAKYTWTKAVLASLIVCIIVFEAWARWVTARPLDAPLTLAPAGRIDQEVEIRRDCPHSLELVFSSSTLPRAEVTELVGARPRTGGVVVPMKWSLLDPNGQAIASGEAETAGISGHSRVNFFRPVFEGLRLPRGRYRLSAALIRDVPEMDRVSARLRLVCSNGKRLSGWQDNLLFYGWVAEWLVALPLAALLTLILLALAMIGLLRGRRGDPS